MTPQGHTAGLGLPERPWGRWVGVVSGRRQWAAPGVPAPHPGARERPHPGSDPRPAVPCGPACTRLPGRNLLLKDGHRFAKLMCSSSVSREP